MSARRRKAPDRYGVEWRTTKHSAALETVVGLLEEAHAAFSDED